MNPILDFVEERCDLISNGQVPKIDLWKAFERWPKHSSDHLRRADFYRDIEQIPGVSSLVGNGNVRFFRGVALKPAATITDFRPGAATAKNPFRKAGP